MPIEKDIYLEMYAIEGCPFCNAARELVKKHKIPTQLKIVAPKDKERTKAHNGMNTFPQIFLHNKGRKTKIGGYQDLVNSL